MSSMLGPATGALAGITTINGARVLAPTQGVNLTDANQTIHVSEGANRYMPAGTTTGARTKTIGVTGAADKRILTVEVRTQGHNVVFNDDAAAALATVTAGDAEVLDFWYDATTLHYKLAGRKALQ